MSIQIKVQSWPGRWLDIAMLPLMYLLQGTLRESPQITHRWNNRRLSNQEFSLIDSSLTVRADADTEAPERWFGPLPIFHTPVFGGWKKFVVLEPAEPVSGQWFVGWIAFDLAGMSKLPLSGQVRLLRGPQQTRFFGFDCDGNQIALRHVADGEVGRAGTYRLVPLL